MIDIKKAKKTVVIKVRSLEQQMIDTFKAFILTKGDLEMDLGLEEYMEIALNYIEQLEQGIVLYDNLIEELKDKLLTYGETFDSKTHKQFQRECLNLIEKIEHLVNEHFEKRR